MRYRNRRRRTAPKTVWPSDQYRSVLTPETGGTLPLPLDNGRPAGLPALWPLQVPPGAVDAVQIRHGTTGQPAVMVAELRFRLFCAGAQVDEQRGRPAERQDC